MLNNLNTCLLLSKKNESRVYILITLFIIFAAPLSMVAQQYQYKPLNLSWKNKVQKRYLLSQSELKNFFDVTLSLPQNYVKDGTVDYTRYIQNALNNYNKVLLPNFPVLINDNSLILKSNSVVYFQKESILKMKKSHRGNLSTDHFNLFTIRNVDNVKIYNLNIIGDRYNHIGSKGEWGMGVSILSSSNVGIYGGKISNFWGDGIYISHSGIKTPKYGEYFVPSKDIIIKNVEIDNNRRNGISIITGENLYISDIAVSNSNGTRPMAGLDIEPNNSIELLRNINLNNIYSFNNARDGILIVLNKITAINRNNGVSINIINHYDNYSYSPLAIVSISKDKGKRLHGEINIENAIWNNNRLGIRYNKNISYLPKINAKRINFKTKPNKMSNNEKGYLNVLNIEEIK